MYDIIFTFYSLTRAQQAISALHHQGIQAFLIYAPEILKQQGCGYAVRVAEPDGTAASFLLRQQHLQARKIFRKYSDSSMEEVFL